MNQETPGPHQHLDLACMDEQGSMSEDILIADLWTQYFDTHTRIHEMVRRRSATHRCIPVPEISRQYTSDQHFAHFCKSKSVVSNDKAVVSIHSYRSSFSKGLPPSPDSSKRTRTAGGGSNGRRSTLAYLIRLSYQCKHELRKYDTLTFDQIQPFGVLGARNVWYVQRIGRTQRALGLRWGTDVHDSTQNNWYQLSGGNGDSLTNPLETIAELR